MGFNQKPANLASKVKGQIKVTPWRCTLIHPNQFPYQVSTSNTLRLLRYSLDKIFKLKVTMTRSKVKLRSLQTCIHQPVSLPNTDLLQVIVSNIKPGQDFKGQGHCSTVIGQIKGTWRHCTLTLLLNVILFNLHHGSDLEPCVIVWG